jgi:hypothetical protein
MGVVFTKDSLYAVEMRKWEATHTEFGAPGRPYQFREFPKRLYKAERTDRGIQITEAMTAEDADMERNLQSRGFHFGQDAAIAAIEREQTVFGQLAAEREFAIQHGRLSDAAVAEVRTAEAHHGAAHLPDVPVARRGRRAKTQEN